jgi:transmembrane 9 superfamily protein 2/4
MLGEDVPVKVNKLDSVKTQFVEVYYSLNFPQPEHIMDDPENLGEILGGERVETSPFHIQMNVKEDCKILAPAPNQGTKNSVAEMAEFAKKVADEYSVNLLVENLPVFTMFKTTGGPPGQVGGVITQRSVLSNHYLRAVATLEPFSLLPYPVATKRSLLSPIPFFLSSFQELDENGYATHYEKGYMLGFTDDHGAQYVNNHLRLTLDYHEDPKSFIGYRIVGFLVEPFSVAHQLDGEWNGVNSKLKTCNEKKGVSSDLPPQPVSKGSATKIEQGSDIKAGFPLDPAKDNMDIIWTYDVRWRSSTIRWASRWDMYLKMP